MKLKKDLVLRKVADNWVVLPLATSTVDLNGMLMLNESGAMLWNMLQQNGDVEAIVDALIQVYDVSREVALADVESFIEKLRSANCIED